MSPFTTTHATASAAEADAATSPAVLVCLAVLSWSDLIVLASPTIGLVAGPLMFGAAVGVKPAGAARAIRTMLVAAGVLALIFAVTNLIVQAA